MVRAISCWTLTLPRVRESDIVLVMAGGEFMHPFVRQRRGRNMVRRELDWWALHSWEWRPCFV